MVTDGPFVETKEQVGGFFIIEARDLDEAIRVASNHPAANIGGEIGWAVEVRPIEAYQAGWSVRPCRFRGRPFDQGNQTPTHQEIAAVCGS